MSAIKTLMVYLILMNSYNVPQDVEADDKLLGPFSFRQFIYLVVVAGSVAIAWALGTLFIGLAIIPLPAIILFGALALPIKKDQPMETYLLAVVSFFVKPRKRIWRADGIESLIEITAPKVEEVQYTKDLSESEATRRLTYLSNIADSQGWAIKTGDSSPMREDLYNEAMSTTDILDENGRTAANLSAMMDSADQKRRDEVIENMKESFTKEEASTGVQSAATQNANPPTMAHFGQQIQPQTTPTAPVLPAQPEPLAAPSQDTTPPDIIGPASEEDQASLSSSERNEDISPDIINLANNNDLSVETIAREAERTVKKRDEGEVFVSLR